MIINVEIPDYDSTQGMKYNWEDGFNIEIKRVHNSIMISANKEGLISLANHLLNLAQDKIPMGHHLHFDETNSLEDGSLELIITKN